jgi:hypothetical protein
MTVNIRSVRTNELIRHLQHSGAVPELALFLRRTVEEQDKNIRELTDHVRELQKQVAQLEARVGKGD